MPDYNCFFAVIDDEEKTKERERGWLSSHLKVIKTNMGATWDEHAPPAANRGMAFSLLVELGLKAYRPPSTEIAYPLSAFLGLKECWH